MAKTTIPDGYALIPVSTLKIINTHFEDILNLNKRSECSDKFFRSHFIDTVKAFIATGTIEEVRKAIEKA